MSDAPSLRTRVLALLEVLRAPLLFSPIADVCAGFAVAWTAAGRGELPDDALQRLLPACLAGVCLLAAGMAQNALADAEDDRLRKPARPIPRGDIGGVAVGLTFIVLTGAALATASLAPVLLPAVVSIVLLTVAYHAMFKRRRVLGAACLGALRGLDMSLGVLAATADAHSELSAVAPTTLWHGLGDFSAPMLACTLYGTYVFGASLHASTDDQDDSRSHPASRSGLALACACLGAGAAIPTILPEMSQLARLGGAALLLFALGRLALALRSRPAPAITGVALSNLPLIGAGTAFAAGHPLLSAIALLAFVAGRALLRIFPPS